MKVRVCDPTTLSQLPLLDVTTYLRSSGWQPAGRIGDRATVWTWEDQEILLPLRRDLADLVPRMAEALTTLELVEQRSQLEILADLATASADVIRVRAGTPDSADGTIPIEEGVGLVQQARDMLYAAACVAAEPRLWYPTRRPTRAVRYMERVRLGQTERGSYVVTLISGVPPSLEPRRNGQARLDLEEPFERQVTLTLARGLDALGKAAQESAGTGDFDAFEAAVSRGVSANLCEAVAAMGGVGATSAEVDVSLAWARSRPPENPEPCRVLLPADALPIILQAGRIFRATAPREEFTLSGLVVGLRRDEGAALGRVTVATILDGDLRKVVLDLPEPEYLQAVEAHKQEQTVECEGELARDGRSFLLRNARSFRVVTDGLAS